MEDKECLNLIIVGTGTYVCGKESDEFGTIVPAILTYSEKFREKVNIIFVCNSEEGKRSALKKCELLLKITNSENPEIHAPVED